MYKWSKISPRDLARFVDPSLVDGLVLGPDAGAALADPDSRDLVIRGLYDAIAGTGLYYALEEYDPNKHVQIVRRPDQVLRPGGLGTCLDLAVLFSACALSVDLLPVLVVLEGHALVLVSRRHRARDATAHDRSEQVFFDAGVLTDSAKLRQLVDSGAYVAIECTGAAALHLQQPREEPEFQGRDHRHLLSAAAAYDAGNAQLSWPSRPLTFALDVVTLQQVHGIGPLRLEPRVHGERVELDPSPAEGVRAHQCQRPQFAPPGLVTPPKPPVPFVDREKIRSDLRAALGGASPSGPQLLVGELGSGVSTLLTVAASEARADRANGVVLLDAFNLGHREVLASVHDAFCPCGRTLTIPALREYLAHVDATVAVDLEGAVPRANLDALVRDAPSLAWLGGGTPETDPGRAESHDVHGLPVEATLELAALTLRRALDPDEEAVVRDLHQTNAGRPLPTLQAVRRARHAWGRLVPDDRGDPGPSLPQRLHVPFAVASGGYVPRELVEAWSGASGLSQLDALVEEGLLEEETSRYRYRYLGLPLPQPPVDDVQRYAAILADWLEATADHPELQSDTLDLLPAVLASVDDALVVRLARASDRALALTGNLTRWGSVLSIARAASYALKDLSALAWSEHQLGTLHLLLEEHDTAVWYLQSALSHRPPGSVEAAATTANLDLARRLAADPIQPPHHQGAPTPPASGGPPEPGRDSVRRWQRGLLRTGAVLGSLVLLGVTAFVVFGDDPPAPTASGSPDIVARAGTVPTIVVGEVGELQVLISNDGDGVAVVTALAPEGEAFALADDGGCLGELAPGEDCKAVFSFAAKSAGTHTAILGLEARDQNDQPVDVDTPLLTGLAVHRPTTEPSAPSIDDVWFDTPGRTLLELSHVGDLTQLGNPSDATAGGVPAITVLEVRASPESKDLGTLTAEGCEGKALAVGGSCELLLTATMATRFSATVGTLEVDWESADHRETLTLRVPINGRTPDGGLTLDPSTLDLGNVRVGDPTTRTVDLRNTANIALTSAAFATTDGLTVDTSKCPEDLDPGQGCTAVVSITPATEGDITASASWRPAVGGEVVMPVTGVAGIGRLDAPPSIDVRWGETETLDLRNSGSYPLSVTIATEPARWTASLSGCTDVPSDESCTLTVTAIRPPGAAGPSPDGLVLAHDGASKSESITLNGFDRIID